MFEELNNYPAVKNSLITFINSLNKIDDIEKYLLANENLYKSIIKILKTDNYITVKDFLDKLMIVYNNTEKLNSQSFFYNSIFWSKDYEELNNLQIMQTVFTKLANPETRKNELKKIDLHNGLARTTLDDNVRTNIEHYFTS